MPISSTDKLKELIIYISFKCSEDSNFSKTKLNKILFYSDFLYYFKNHKAITNHDYVHLQYGPVPNNIDVLIRDMLGKDIAMAISQNGPYRQEKLVALREANLNLFNPEMIAHIDSVINYVCNMTATKLSNMSHDELGYIVTGLTNKIPYNTIFVKSIQNQKVTSWDKRKSKEIANLLQGQYGFPKTT